MGKRRTRITPRKIKRVKRVTKSPGSLNKSQKEKSSNEDNMTAKRSAHRVRSRTTNTSKRKASSSEKDTNSSRYSSNSSIDNGSHEENVEIPKKKRHVGERAQRDTRSKSKGKSMSNRKEDAVTNRISHVKSERKATRSSRRESRTSERIRDIIITKKTFSKWKPLSTPTKDYIKQVIADKSIQIIGIVSSDKRKDEVQHCLTNLEKRILVKMNKIRGPSQPTGYREIEQESKGAEESLTSVSNLLSLIEDELQEQRRLLEIEEENLKALSSQPTKKVNNTTKQLHPLLQKKITPNLNLPRISQEALRLPIPKIPAELCKGAGRLSETLFDFSNDVDNMGITSWLESLSHLQASMNQS